MSATHTRERRLIDRHFAGASSPRTEPVMRAHLDDCQACRAYYQQHLVLASLDPQAPAPVDRLAAGLGIAPARGRPWLMWPALGLAAATAALVVVWPRPAADDGFAARGSGTAPASALEVYRVSAGGAPAGRAIGADDELGFAYRNPRGHARLVVVGVDERGQIYWYHPDPDVTEAAVAIERQAESRELPEAIRHHYQGRSLRILGIFGDPGLSARSVKKWLDGSGCQALRAHLARIECVTVALDVEAKR
jgi:hypothetical protein